MPRSFSASVSTALALWYFLAWTLGVSVWVQAIDNNNRSNRKNNVIHSHSNGSVRKQFDFRDESIASNRISVRKGRGAGSKQILYGNSNQDAAPSQSPTSAPIAIPSTAPTPAPSSFSNTRSDNDDHTAWLLQQQQYNQQQQYQIQSTTISTVSPSSSGAAARRRKGKGIFPSFVSGESLAATTRSLGTSARAYSQNVYRANPTTFWVASSSIVVFFLWNLLPPARSILTQYFLASRRSVRWSFGSSLVLSAVSHTSFRHLLVNLLVFLNLSPALLSIRVPSSSWASRNRRPHAGLSTARLWPLFVGGALSGNALFLLFRPRGSCLGLSGVTCAMLAAYASAVPDRVLRFLFMGIVPVTLRAATMVQILLAVSLAGALFLPSSPVSHLAHLGGLLFGLLYYQNVMTQSKRMLPTTKVLFGR
eukprot:jgi/Psemu1/214393/e_gw1.688.13.1